MNYGASFPSSSSDNEKSDSSEEDNEVDETLVRELRESLHFCVGKICRAEELAAVNEVGGNNGNDSEECDGMSTSSSTKKTRTVMSKEAIGALTELVYHYSTSSLANDLCAFSNHSNRRTVKADDVLLVARKEKHILAELKRKIKADQPTVAAAGRKTKKSAANKKKSSRKTSSSKKPLFNSGKKKKSMLLDSSSSSSSNSDSDSDIDPMERIRQRRLELRQKNLNNTAFGCNNNTKDDDDSSNSSSSSDGLELNITSGKEKKKRSNNPKRTVDAQNDDMVIDLQDSE